MCFLGAWTRLPVGREAFLAAWEACPGTSFQASEASSCPVLEASSCPEASFHWEVQGETRPLFQEHPERRELQEHQEHQEHQELQTDEEASCQVASCQAASFRVASFREASFLDWRL